MVAAWTMVPCHHQPFLLTQLTMTLAEMEVWTTEPLHCWPSLARFHNNGSGGGADDDALALLAVHCSLMQ
jgi:hypothetical protein